MQKPTARAITHSTFPKIKRNLTTAYTIKALSTTDLRPVPSDTLMMREIEKKIEEQRRDLEERSIAIKTLLTHFENIASMCREEKNRNIEFRQQNMDLIKEIKYLKKMLEEKSSINERPIRQKTQSTISIVNVDEYEGIWKENDRLKETIKKMEKDHQERFKEINGLHEQITSLKQIIAKLDKDLMELNMDLNVAKGNKRKLEEDYFESSVANEKLRENIKGYVEEIERLNQRVATLNKENEGLQEIIDQRDKDLQKVKLWNSKLSTQNQEYLENKTKEGSLLCQIQINPSDTLEMIIDKFTKALGSKDEKLIELNKEMIKLKDKINKGSVARKELLVSIEEFRNNNHNDMIKYEKLVQQLENTKKLKDSEIKDFQESLTRSESQKRGYMDDLQALEIQFYNEKQMVSQLMKKKEDLENEVKKLNIKIEIKDEEIEEKNKVIGFMHEIELKFKLSQKEIKAVRDENLKLEKMNDSLTEKYTKDKNAWTNEEMSLNKKILTLQDDLNNEKVFSSFHLKELIKLKTALSAQDTKYTKEFAQEEERKFRAKIATLEMDLAEQKDLNLKLERNLDYSGQQIQEKTKMILELEEKLGSALDELKNPNFIGVTEKVKKMKERETAVSTEVSKIAYAIEAFENGMICFVCLNCLDNPILVIPCGHAVCSKCLNLTTLACPQCSKKIHGQYRIDWLDQLVDKIVFQRQVLDSLKNLISIELFS